MKLIYFILFFSVISLNTFSQNEFNNWIFGNNAWIDFSSGSPEAEIGSSLQSLHGTASISDSDGNLLFYSNGETIWNRNHEIMDNGDDLIGDVRVTHSAVIVPKPGSDFLYYVFSLDRDCLKSEGFGDQLGNVRYHIVDMTENAGLGKVISKENLLLAGGNSEKLVAIPHANGEDYWLVTMIPPISKLRSYLLTSDGLNLHPQEFEMNINMATRCPGTSGGYGSIGYIKASPNGTKLALTNFTDGFVGVYSFNTYTGEIFNEKILPVGDNPYGLEFSPNSRFLYVSFAFNSQVPISRQLRQYDTNLNNGPSIHQSERFIVSTGQGNAIPNHSFLAAMQIGPDDKIYVAVSDHDNLSSIDQPNNQGLASSYNSNSVYLRAGISKFGLPMFYYPQTITPELLFGESCANETTNFQLIGSEFTNITWDFGDNSSILSNSDLSETSHVYTDSGEFTATATFNDFFGNEHTISKQVFISELPTIKDDLVYSRESEYSGIIVEKSEMDSLINEFNQPNLSITYHASLEDAQTDENIIGPPNMTFHEGTYYAKANNIFSDCLTITTFEVQVELLEDDNDDNGSSEPRYNCQPLIPTAITPNNDRINDRLVFFNNPNHSCSITIKMVSIYDRWGNKVYEGTDSDWNGRNQNGDRLTEGIYLYKVVYDYVNEFGEGSDANHIGTVAILF